MTENGARGFAGVVPAVPTAQVRALLRLLSPDHMTPVAVRQFEAACDEWEAEE